MVWWHWIVLGLVLISVELLTPGGFFVIFFGASALVVGALLALGLAGPTWLPWLLFPALSIASLLLFRGALLRGFTTADAPGVRPSLVGEIALPLDAIAPGAVGRVELRGTHWSARNNDSTALASGRRCRVTRVDGLMLHIRAEEEES